MSSPTEPESLESLLHASAFAGLGTLGWLRLTGEDRVRWLNGMTTNNIGGLEAGRGCYTFFLNAQGRILADAYAWMQADAILLETAGAGSLATLLDRFIIMDDVELEVVGQDVRRAGLLLAGPKAAGLLEALELPAPAELQLLSIIFDGQPVDLLHTYSPLVPTFELWSDPATIGLLAETLRHAGALEAAPETLDQLRILSGIPLYGTDIRNSETARDLPQETAPAGTPSRALHFSKGCYLGQEIVERIHSRGAVHRTFSGFVLTGELPAPGATLTLTSTPDKPIGELTSVARIGDRTFALGYIRRDALVPHGQAGPPASIVYPGGTAVPAALPFAI